MPDSSTPTPVFKTVAPSSIGLAGGTIKITGKNLNEVNLVTIAGQGATNTHVKDDGTVIEATFAGFPSTMLGSQPINAYNKGVEGKTGLTIDIEKPVLQTISPSTDLICGGKQFTITGSNLTGASIVSFGQVGVTDIKVTDTTITGTVPQGHKVGDMEVTVKTQGVASNSLGFTYTLAASVPLKLEIGHANLPAGTDVYAYIVGGVKKNGVTTFYYLDADGVPHEMNTKDNSHAVGTFPNSEKLSPKAAAALADNYKLAWADYSIPVTDGMTIDLAKINAANIPDLGTGEAAFSGRIYLSVGVPRLPFTVQAKGYTQPNMLVGPSNSGQFCLFDWVEFSFDGHQNLNANTTQVDGFGMSLTLSATPQVAGSVPVTEVGLREGFSRNEMVEVLSSLYAEGLVKAPAGTMDPGPDGTTAYPDIINFNTGTLLRVCSPKTIVTDATLNAAVKDFFDDTIDEWYTEWAKTPLVTQTGKDEYFSAMVTGASATVLTFKPGQFTTLEAWQNAPTTGEFSFDQKITTQEIWQCNGMLATGSPASKNAGKVIAAAFNRGVVSNSLSDVTWDVSSFYPTDGIYNQWASLTHQYGQHHLAYGFPYDDVCDQNPTVAMAIPTEVKISLEAF